MELGPIFRTLIRNKTRVVLIGAEVALTLALVVNCLNMMLEIRGQIVQPTGLDEANILVVRSQPFSEAFKDEGYRDNSRRADLEAFRLMPGVVAAEAFSQIPLSGSGSSSGYKPLGSEMDTLATGIFTVGIDATKTLGVRLNAGRDLELSDINDADSKNVLVTKAFADRLFPDGDALGRQIQGRTPENPHTIVGIIDHMHGSWPMWTYIGHVALFPGKPGSFSFGTRYMIRTEAGKVESLFKLVEEKLLAMDNGRNVEVRSLAEIKAETLQAETAVIKLLGGVIFLLVFVTFLGIVGITSFSVTERTHQIGTRRALGARQWDIVRYFLTENWLITSLGISLGVILTYVFNYVLVNLVSGATMSWHLVAAGVLGLWVAGQLAALFPALRAARVSPSVATRNV